MNRAARGFGQDDLDALFPDGAPVTVVPWARSSLRLSWQPVEAAQVRALLALPPRSAQFCDLDPRDLSASQQGLVRAGVAYYRIGEYERSGRTYADQFALGNKYPVVLRSRGELVVLSGHHRAAAALLRAEPLRARLVSGLPPADGDDPAVVTPSLLVGEGDPKLPHVRCESAHAAEVLVNIGATAWLTHATDPAVRGLLAQLAVLGGWIDHQLHYARTGRIRPIPAWPDHAHELYGCAT
jgi:hypothetical protein